MENDHLQWIFPLKMMIFHSYVSLPEGTVKILTSLIRRGRPRSRAGRRVAASRANSGCRCDGDVFFWRSFMGHVTSNCIYTQNLQNYHELYFSIIAMCTQIIIYIYVYIYIRIYMNNYINQLNMILTLSENGELTIRNGKIQF